MDEVTTPVIYSVYGDDYLFNDLQRIADANFDKEYIGSIKNGYKHVRELESAYNDIMTGLGDGSITINGRTFHDSKGRYFNADNPKEDYYGMAAHYIYKHALNALKYIKPENNSKKKWGNDYLLEHALTTMFGTTNPSWKAFRDQDQEVYDKKTKTKSRGFANRTQILLNYLNLFDQPNYLDGLNTDITPEQRKVFEENRLQLKAKLESDGFTDDDVLYLNKMLPGFDWGKLFSNKESVSSTTSTGTTSTGTTSTGTTSTGTTSTGTTSTVSDFDDWYKETYPTYTGQLTDIDISYRSNEIGPWCDTQIKSALKTIDKEYLIKYFNKVLYENYDFGSSKLANMYLGGYLKMPKGYVLQKLLNELASRGIVFNENGLNFIPGTANRKNNTVYGWDGKNKLVHKKAEDARYFKESARRKYDKKYSTTAKE